MNRIEFKSGMKLFLYVWDSGEIEGFAVYVNDTLVTERNTLTRKYPLEPLDSGESWGLIVQFAGQDGGATKIVDEATTPQTVLAHQDTGLSHAYMVSCS